MKFSIIEKFMGRNVGSIFATPIGIRQDGFMPVPEQCYFDLRLEVMDIAAKSRLLTEYYPVLQGNVSFGSLGTDVTTTALITPEIPGHGEQSHLNRVHLRAQELAPLQVYRGGDVDVALGLYATPGDDWAKQFLGFAKAVSDVAGSASLAAAVAVAQPLKLAFDALLSRGKVTLELGLKVDLMKAGLRNHTYFLLAGTEQELESEDMSFNGTEVLHRGSPLAGADVILISLNFSKERPDLYSMPVALSAQKALKGIAEILIGGGAEIENGIADLYRRFAAEVMLHDQLTSGDKARLIQDIRSNIKELRSVVAVPESRSGDVAGRLESLSDGSPAVFELKPTETPAPKQISMGEAMQL